MKKILIVDDEESMRMMMRTILKTKGYIILESDNGEDALEMIRQQSPDIIISDVMMDNMNGFLLREAVKEDPDTAKIPFILMTGLAANAGAWEADSHVDYITKPFIMPDLIQLIERRLNSV